MAYNPEFGKMIEDMKKSGASAGVIKDLTEINRLMKDNNMSQKEFVNNFSKLKNISKGVSEDMESINEGYKEAKDNLKEQNKIWGSIVPMIDGIVKGSKKNKKVLMEMVTELDSIYSIEDKIEHVQKLKAKAIKSGNKQLEIELGLTENLLGKEESRSKLQGTINKQTDKYFGMVSDNLSKIPLLGGKISKIFSNWSEELLPKFGKALSENLTFAAAEGSLKGFGDGLGVVGKTITQIFGKSGTLLLGLAAAAAAFIGILVLANKISEGISETAKELDISNKAANKLKGNLNGMTQSIGKTLEAAKGLGEAFGNMGMIIRADGTIAKGMEKLVDQAAQLQYSLSLSNEEGGQLAYYAKQQGQDLSEITLEIDQQVKSMHAMGATNVSLRKVHKDIAKLSKTQLKTFGKSTKELVKSAATAQVLGTTLSETIDAGMKSLDIETALGNEMKARALIGKEMNFEAIRQATILGDTNGILRAQADVIGELSEADLSGPGSTFKMDAMAEALNMTTDQIHAMRDSIDLSKELGVNVDQIADMSAEQLKAMGRSKGITSENFKQVLANKQNVSLAERNAELMAKMGDIMKPFKNIALSIGETFAKFAETIGPKGVLVIGVGLAVVAFVKIRRMLRRAVQLAQQMSMAISNAAAASWRMNPNMGGGYGGAYAMPGGAPMAGGPMVMGGPGGGGKTPKGKTPKGRPKSRRRSRSRGRGGGGLFTALMLAPMAMDLFSSGSDPNMDTGDIATEATGVGASIVQYNKLMDPVGAEKSGGGGIFKKLKSSIKSIGSSVMNFGKDKTKGAKGGGGFFSGIADKVTNFAKSAKGYVGGKLGALKDFGGGLLDKGKNMLGGLKEWGKGAGSSIKGWFSGIGSSISSGLSSAGDWLKGAKNTVVSGVKTAGQYMMNPSMLLKDAMKALKGAGPKVLKSMMKLGPISALVEGIFTHLTIKDLIAQGMPREELNQEVGREVSGSLGGLIGGVGAAAVTQVLNIAPGLGVLAAPLSYMLGDALGRWVGESLADMLGAAPIGKAVLDTVYPGTVKEAYAAQNQGGETVNAGNTETTVELNDGTVKFNKNDKIGGVLDNKTVLEMVGYLKQIAEGGNVAVITPEAVGVLAEQIGKINSFRK